MKKIPNITKFNYPKIPLAITFLTIIILLIMNNKKKKSKKVP